ncbi:malate dehydrogenase (oxaloacetate-decarboxylating) (NADP(+)) [Malassezia caprae]|uniref:Malic enzyme n=1 Tax=Malassezia caprae TaxID=1381934 RepID=A0AAF0E6A9_9BASI|nr:malate dehydrogenase (oxaloacetate-decarboxylating) (NADP(+)) [Malassezia caprae]
MEERSRLGLEGLLPPAFQTIDQQLARIHHQLLTKEKPIQKHIELMNLRQRNERLFYAYVIKNLLETLPLVYTPTVGEACQKFSSMFRRPEGLTLTLKDKGNIGKCVANWPRPQDTPRVAVITDGSRILGLGDLGWNGLGITIGKLSLYVACAGVHPQSTMPIVVDIGTDNEELLNDPLYLGLRQKRASDEELTELVDEIMYELNKRYPFLIIQFEDWSSANAFKFLDRYQNKYPMFNDDIQGTGAVILGGFINAARKSTEASGQPLEDQRILMVGAGSASVGVAKQLMNFFTELGLTEQQAKEHIWTTDSKGLVTANRGDKLAEHKQYFARHDNGDKQYKELEDIIDYVKPTAILGMSTIRGTFTPEVLKRMAALNKRPIVMALSNPTSKAECTFEEALKYTDNKVIFAAGSPFDPVEIDGKTRYSDQGNNFYIFPGVGLAGALTRAKHITESIITESALALADSMNEKEKEMDLLYPLPERVREIAHYIAFRCIKAINKEGLAQDNGFTAGLSDDDLFKWVHDEMWVPSYDH